MRSLRVLASPKASGRAGNPYIEQLTQSIEGTGATVSEFTRRALLDRPDVIHVHWPIGLVRFRAPHRAVMDVIKVLGLLRLAKRRGSCLVWTGHDTEPHEGLPTWLHRWYFSQFLSLVDGLIVLSDASLTTLRGRWPQLAKTPSATIPHGHYRAAYPAAPSRSEARRILGIQDDEKVFLALGQVRPYKALPEMARAFQAAAEPGERLYVVGAANEAKVRAELLEAATSADSVETRLSRVSEEEVAIWHAAADVCLLFYSAETSLNSGAALLALSFDRPVIVRDSPTMRDLSRSVGGGWVTTVEGDAQDAVRGAKVAFRSTSGEAPLDHLDWARIGAATEAAYRRFIALRHRAQTR